MRRPVPRVAVIVDMFGSIDDHLLWLAWTEVHGCLCQLGIKRDILTVYVSDTDIALAARPFPDVVVGITDGLTPWPRGRLAAT